MGFAVDGAFLELWRVRHEALVKAGHKFCSRCGGTGQYGSYGRCFRCGGCGIDPRCPCLTGTEDRKGYFHPTTRALYRRMAKDIKWMLEQFTLKVNPA